MSKMKKDFSQSDRSNKWNTWNVSGLDEKGLIEAESRKDETFTEKEDIQVIKELLTQLLKDKHDDSSQPKYLNTSEVCDLLNISYSTIIRHIHKGLIPAYKLGNKYFIPEHEIFNMNNRVN